MKMYLKIAAAAVLIVLVVPWALSSVQTTSYSGTNLNFPVGTGAITITNPSDEPMTVQFVGNGSTAFSVSSAVTSGTGTSTRKGSGSEGRHVFEFVLPAGVSEFRVARGKDVTFVAPADTELQATVAPLSENDVRATLIVAIVVVLAALFYISNATGHRFINMLRGKQPAPVVMPSATSSEGGQGKAARSYGDNRA